MATHIDILEDRERLGKPFLASVALHACIFLLLAAQGMLKGRPAEVWGTPNSLGGSSVGITPVNQIPLPARSGRVNPLASDTESRVPEPPPAKPEPKRAPEPDPEAIAIRGRQTKQAPRRTPARRQPSKLPTKESQGQVYSDTGRALTSPMMGQTGTGGVGIGRGGAFGSRFGWYRDLLERAIASKWRTDQVDPRLETAPPVVVTFVIQRDGSIGNVRVEQSSGNKALDYSALRAIYDASPFQPLPPGYGRSDASVEIYFQLQR